MLRRDVGRILKKLEQYSPSTRLQRMSEEERSADIFKKANRQLLIGLMEATTGLGFAKITSNDFASVGDDRRSQFLVIAGLESLAAREIATREGWSAVTIRRLAEEIEYSQPVLYSHFENRDAIVAAVAIEGFRELATTLRTTAGRSTDRRTSLSETATGHCQRKCTGACSAPARLREVGSRYRIPRHNKKKRGGRAAGISAFRLKKA